jgi:hypothetical protein
MEWWNDGLMGIQSGICLYFIHWVAKCIKKDLILLNPSFQHSSIPSFQGIGLGHSQFSLTWPKGPGFQ